MPARWTNIYEMLHDVRLKSREVGRAADSEDNPMTRTIGFSLVWDAETACKWQIGLSDLKASLDQTDGWDPAWVARVRENIRSADGRRQLAQDLFSDLVVVAQATAVVHAPVA
jgi:hypothetical protein